MWVWFDLFCDSKTQQRLHKMLRDKVKEWQRRELTKAGVLTYHFRFLPTDSLYVCLDIPAVKVPDKRAIQLGRELVIQIPQEIITFISEVCTQNDVRLEIKDYEFVLTENRASEQYRDAPINEILRFASIGTRIALKVLDLEETREQPWTLDKGKADFVMSSLRRELGADYFWLREAFHFVCNPLRLSFFDEGYFWKLADR